MKTQHKTKNKGKTSNGGLLIALGITTVVLGGVGYWYYKKQKTPNTEVLGGLFTKSKTDKTSTSTPNSSSSIVNRNTRFRCSSKNYPLEYGTCHSDVKTLQLYLIKIYKDDLGSSGRNRDGVDGMFGSKTSRAAKKHLGKISFDKQDIDGMKTAIKTIKK